MKTEKKTLITGKKPIHPKKKPRSFGAGKRKTGKNRFRLALCSWETGPVPGNFGAQAGGLGLVLKELPRELLRRATENGQDLEIEILSPCFAWYDKSRLEKLRMKIPAVIEGSTFYFDVYRHRSEITFRVKGRKHRARITWIFFWDEWQLSWTTPASLYPEDLQMAAKLYSSMAQAMSGYIQKIGFDTVHLHDYHVAMVPFFLDSQASSFLPVHFTIHNATYQGIIPLIGGGYASLDRLGLPGEKLFHKYFDFFDNLNLTKACMLKVHENGGRVTTVSGDLEGSWGYAAELKENRNRIWEKAKQQKGRAPGDIFVPNRHLDLFEKIAVAGITNGLSEQNRPENMAELKASFLAKTESGTGRPVFSHPEVEKQMLLADHNFDISSLDVKKELARLLHLECFGFDPGRKSIIITIVGRLVEQKNFQLAADIMEPVLGHDPNVRFIILASPGDETGRTTRADFQSLASRHPGHVYYNDTFSGPLSRLILAGGTFCLIPSRFEPCGLVDYEASLCGNIVIGHLTGGLAKVRKCAYLYEWLDRSDRFGEARAFAAKIMEAIDNYRWNPEFHGNLMRAAMSLDTSWQKSAQQYLDLYRFGALACKWRKTRAELIRGFAGKLGNELELFARWFSPAAGEYADNLDWDLKRMVEKPGKSKA